MTGAALATPLTGRVVEKQTGEALAGVEVHVTKAGASEVVAELETDSNGAFALPETAAGEYTLVLSKANYVEATLRIHADSSGASASPVVARLVRLGVIAGQVWDAQQQPLRGARVLAMPKPQEGKAFRPYQDWGSGREATVDEQGTYRLYHLAPGQYAVAVVYGASSLAVGSSGSKETNGSVGSGVLFYPSNSRIQFFTVVDGEEYKDVNFTLLPSAVGSVSGQVNAARSPGRFWIALTPVGQPAFAIGVTPAELDGSFHLEGIPLGEYYVFASGPTTGRGGMGATLAERPLFGRTEVQVSGPTLESVTVAITEGRSASFLVRAVSQEAEKACPARVQLRISPLQDWGAYLERSVETVLGKVQTVHDLAPARYSVTVEKLGSTCRTTGEAMLDLSTQDGATPLVLTVGLQK